MAGGLIVTADIRIGAGKIYNELSGPFLYPDPEDSFSTLFHIHRLIR